MALTTPIEVTDGRPKCCEYSSGRMFFGYKNTVYFTQVMEAGSISSLNKCYQVNDPTSEQISDLLATDGGTIQVDDATDIIQLKKFRDGVLVYSLNGVWYLSGAEGGFSATNYSNQEITRAGCISPHSVVVADDKQYFWSSEGIFMIALNEFGIPTATNIIEGIYQTEYNKISKTSQERCTGAYNRITKQVTWLYASTTGDYKYAYDRGLRYDLRSGGMWKLDYETILSEAQGNAIIGMVNTTRAGETDDAVYVSLELGAVSSTQTYSIDFAQETDTSFQDFGTNYQTAFIETGYETLGKPSNKKIALYTTTHFLQTEENWVSDGSGGLELDLQSGCQFRSKWDWNNSASNGRWGTAQQAYRFRRINVPASAGAFDSGERVITTRNKILGRGNALSLRFEQEAGKDMQLLGYTNTYTVKGRM